MCVKSQSSEGRNGVQNVLDFIEQSLQEYPVGGVRGIVPRISWQGQMSDGNSETNPSTLKTEVRIGNGCLDYQERCAFNDTRSTNGSHDGFMVHAAIAHELSCKVFRGGKDDSRHLVLAPVRQLRKYGEQWGQYSMGTVEGLKTQHGVSYCIRDTTKPLFGVVGEVFELIPNDESGSIRFVWQGTSRQVCNGIDEVIEGIPEIGYAITNHQRPSIDSGLGTELGTKVVLGEILIALVNDTVRVVFQPHGNFRIQSMKVTAGPGHLCIHAL